MAKILNAFLILYVFSIVTISSANQCVQKSPCLCVFSEYEKIDLTEVISGKNAEKSFLEGDYNQVQYFFHGCTDGKAEVNTSTYGVTNGTVIKVSASLYYVNKTVAPVKVDNTTIMNVTVEVVTLGKSDQINFNEDKNSYQLVYKNGTNVPASVHLTCDATIQKPFFAVLDNDTSTQNFALVSPHACIVTHHPGMSAGSVLIILLIVAIMIYLIGGGFVLYFMRGARGIELIPNIDFWKSLPGLVRDGILFLFGGCNASSVQTSSETYDRI